MQWKNIINDFKPPMYCLDTNVFLRLLIKENEKIFLSCKILIENIKTGKTTAITTGLVLAEIGWTLKSYYKFKRADIAMALQSIVSIPKMKIIDEYDYMYATKLYLDNNVKYIDCCIASIPRIRNKKIIVVSYDKDFDKLNILRKEPKEII